MTNESRRSFLLTTAGLWQAASVRAQQRSKADQGRSETVFLNPAQRQILVKLMDRFVPSDERSAGAVGARVDEYIDHVLLHADSTLQTAWRNGLDHYGAVLKAKTASGIDNFLQRQSRREFAPLTEEERFFVLLKVAITEGFYTSKEGIESELGYQGMSFDMDASGCNHVRHHVPSGYKPLLQPVKKA